MNKKTPSTRPQNLVHARFETLSRPALWTLDLLLDASCDLDTIFFTQETIGKKIGRHRHTVIKALKELVAAGLIEKVNRNYQSCIYSINKILLTPVWHKELYHWFRRYPALIIPLALSLLFSPAAAKKGKLDTIISGSSGFIYLKQPESYEGYPKGQKKVTKGINMKQVDPKKTQLARNIALALIKRGARLTNSEALGIMSFHELILQRASTVMKQRSALQQPDRYFFGLCRKLSEEAGLRLDIETVEYMRSNAVRLLSEAEEMAALEQPESDNALHRTPKREPREQLYNEQVRQGQAQEQQAAEQRKPAHLKAERTVLLVEAELQGWREALVQQEAKHKNISLWPYLRGLADKNIAHLEYELREMCQISITIHEGVAGNGATAATPTIFCPDVNLSALGE